MPEGAAVLFIDTSNRVLLRLRDERPDLPFAGQWDLIGGAVENDEAPLETARREVSEEIGLVLGSTRYFGDFIGVVVNHVYLAALNMPAEEIILREGQKVAWFSIRDALQLDLVPWVGEMLHTFSEQRQG